MALMVDVPAPIVVRATNEARARLFRGEGEVATDVTERRTIQILLSAGYVPSGDRGLMCTVCVSRRMARPSWRGGTLRLLPRRYV